MRLHTLWLAALGAGITAPLTAQVDPPPAPGTRTVEVAAGKRYGAGGLHRLLLGDTYRDLWTTPIRVPVLNLQTFAGGIKATKSGGGNQTKNLRFETETGEEYVFRTVDKVGVTPPGGFKGSIIESIAQDQISGSHPAAAEVAAPLLQAVGILHVTPILMVMPDDPALGEFREEFAGKLGMIEGFPSKPDRAPGFAGAAEIIDSDSLLPKVTLGGTPRIATREYLAARLMDMFLNDWDRHPGNWKWARMGTGSGAVWRPIPRDRDKPFISYGGIVAVAGKFAKNLVRFEPTYPSMRGLTWNSIEYDRRLLLGLEWPVWDSVSKSVARRVTDRVIDDAVLNMPKEYQGTAPELARVLKVRRDSIPVEAERFYRFLAGVVDLHATELADRATLTQDSDGSVLVEIRSGGGELWFHRRFHPDETSEIRLYTHEGNDAAVVQGSGPGTIRLRLIGGSGTNALADSTAGGYGRRLRFYDAGQADSVGYGPDTLWNRRPWRELWGHVGAPVRDRGGKMAPILGFTVSGDLGAVLKAGVQQYRYGFRKAPFARRVGLIGEYATGAGLWRVTALADVRRESSSWHLTAVARMSEIEIVNFHGFGNQTPEGPAEFYEARQKQWLVHPAISYALGPRSDLSLGPVLQYSTTDSIPGRFISDARPYGFGDFGEAGLRVGLYSDGRNRARTPSSGLLLDLTATWYPALWDVATSFGVLAANTGAYITIPVPVHPVLALRAGGKKLFGDFPFHEAAYLGGRASLRSFDKERFAGDASLYGTAELQVPVARFTFLLPLDLGVYGYADAGRVYLDGASPGGWHTTTGVGAWIGILNPATAVSLEFGDQRGRSGIRVRTGLTF